ncbi:MAG: SPFH domain-containing protein, partial [Phycisphaerales bacterium]
MSTEPLIEIKEGEIGLVEARDGEALDKGQLFAPEVEPADFKKMVTDAAYFLSSGGRKGPQVNVLTPGKYRINTEMFHVDVVQATEVPNATVAVLKSNFGDAPSIERVVEEGEEPIRFAAEGELGVRAMPLMPGKHPINTKAYEVTMISTKNTIVRFTKLAGKGSDGAEEEREINVRTSDGFTFPVDVRIEYRIEPDNAPIVVQELKDDKDGLLNVLNSAVRAIFRNNAESVKALDYVNQRSLQESQSLAMLQEAMAKVGVTVSAVRIGDVGDEETLGDLLKTQRDREIATQEQLTFQEQQKAAEQKKELTRTEQEAEEE